MVLPRAGGAHTAAARAPILTVLVVAAATNGTQAGGQLPGLPQGLEIERVEIQAAEEQRRTLESQVRSENNTRLTLAKIDEMEFKMLLEGEKLKQSGQTIQIEEFNAITSRIKAQREALQAKLKETAE